jgi:hypothetical protein
MDVHKENLRELQTSIKQVKVESQVKKKKQNEFPAKKIS